MSNTQTRAAESAPLLNIEGAVARIRINRPSVHNRLTPEDLETLCGHLRTIDARDELRVVVLEGTGKTFCAGFDLDQILAVAGASLATGQERSAFEETCLQIEHFRLPTVAAMGSAAYGGGTDLALSCDFRVARDDCHIFMPASRLGLHFYASGLERWVARLGLAAAKRMFLTSMTIQAPEMLRVDFVDEICDATSYGERLQWWTDTLAAQAPLTVQGMKRALNAASVGRMDASKVLADHFASLRSADIVEGVTAWHDKRVARFTGR